MDVIKVSNTEIHNLEKSLSERIIRNNVELMQIVNQELNQLLQIAISSAENLGEFIRLEFAKLMKRTKNNQEALNIESIAKVANFSPKSENDDSPNETKSISTIGHNTDYEDIQFLAKTFSCALGPEKRSVYPKFLPSIVLIKKSI